MDRSEIESPLLDGSFQDDNLLLNNTLDWFGGYTPDSNTSLHYGIMDNNIANIDMDNFQINHLIESDYQQRSQGRGETIASITGSILEQLSNSMSTTSLEMSICKSLALFSPIEEPIQTQFSTDSLDVSSILATCCAVTNRNNYTIAFEQSIENQKSNLTTIKTTKLYDCNENKIKQPELSTNCSIQTSISPIYICYPNYTLPDLQFLTKNPKQTYLLPQQLKLCKMKKKHRPLSCNDIEELKKKNFSHITDWPSLNFLLPIEYQIIGKNTTDITTDDNDKEDEMKFLEKKQQQRKRYSLQIDGNKEIVELTDEIDKNLDCFMKFISLERTTTINGGSMLGDIDNKDIGNFTSIMNKQVLLSDIQSSMLQLTKSTKSIVFSQSTAGQILLSQVCPALYNLLSDGLSPYLETIFGRVPNTVWRVIESSIQSGPTLQNLNELVMKINSEELLSEGPIKFNAFICGLLNLSSLTTWLTIIRTKERLLRNHYEPDSFMYLSNTTTRLLYDQIITSTMNKIHFQLDIFYQVKILHESIRIKNKSKSTKYNQNQMMRKSLMKRSFSDERPKKSNYIIPKSKTVYNLNKLKKNEENAEKVDKCGQQQQQQQHQQQQQQQHHHRSGVIQYGENVQQHRSGEIQHGHSNHGEIQHIQNLQSGQNLQHVEKDRFKQLQLQWELLSSEEKIQQRNIFQGSKIPRPITSPVKPQLKKF